MLLLAPQDPVQERSGGCVTSAERVGRRDSWRSPLDEPAVKQEGGAC
jgi:hypothetical protein